MTEKLSEAKKRANKKWDQSHAEEKKIIRARSAAKSFINKYAEEKDLNLLSELIENKRKKIQNKID